VRETLGPLSGASAWNGKLIARLLAEDGFLLRKQIICALHALAGVEALPKIWTF
jgi:urease accessory protein